MFDGQYFASFRAAALEHGASVLGRHTRAKPVFLGTATIVRLISSLWHNYCSSSTLESENLKFRKKRSLCQNEREFLKLSTGKVVSCFMSLRGIIAEIIYFLLTGGCLLIYVGLLVFTVGLRELQTNLKIREIGVNLFKKLF